MVALSRILTSVLGLAVGAAAVACGALIGIEDGVADPGVEVEDAADATSIDSSVPPVDANKPDTSMPDATVGRGPIGKPGGDTSTLPCGNASCTIPAQACCAYRTTGSQPPVFTAECAATCPAAGGTTDKLAALKCSGPFNCPGATPRCCYAPTGSGVETTCKTSCNFMAGELTLCDPNAVDTCGTRTCRNFAGTSMPTSYGYCQ